MLFAVLAKVLLRQPAPAQAICVGLCTGLFVTALAEANDRDPAMSKTMWLVLSWGIVAAVLFYAGLLAQRRRAHATDDATAGWLYGVYAVVWVMSIVAAVFALLSEGGLKVAALAIVPIVLLTPTALAGIRLVRSQDM